MSNVLSKFLLRFAARMCKRWVEIASEVDGESLRTCDRSSRGEEREWTRELRQLLALTHLLGGSDSGNGGGRSRADELPNGLQGAALAWVMGGAALAAFTASRLGSPVTLGAAVALDTMCAARCMVPCTTTHRSRSSFLMAREEWPVRAVDLTAAEEHAFDAWASTAVGERGGPGAVFALAASLLHGANPDLFHTHEVVQEVVRGVSAESHHAVCEAVRAGNASAVETLTDAQLERLDVIPYTTFDL